MCYNFDGMISNCALRFVGMNLRSSRVSERGKPGVVLGLESIKSSVVKWVSRSSGNSNSVKKVANKTERLLSLRSNQSNSGKNGANEAEIGICVDNPDEDLEMGTVFSKGIKDGSNTDDKGLFLGSEVLDPIKDFPVSSPEGEIEEESVERVHVEERNKPSTRKTHYGFKEEIKPPVDCEHESEHVLSEKLAGGGMDKIRQKKGRGRPRKKKRMISNLKKNETEVVNGGANGVVKHKRGRKRKNMESLESKGEKRGENGVVKLKRGRKRKNMEGSESKGDERGENGVVKSKKGRKKKNTEGSKYKGDERAKKKKAGVCVRERVLGLRCLAATLGVMVVHGGRPEKKVERRGRPRKVVQNETNEIPSQPKKKRGRPRKIDGENSLLKKKKQGKEKVSQKKRLKDMVIKKLKMRQRKLKVRAVKNSKNGLKTKDLKKSFIVGEDIMGRGKYKQLLRDKLVKVLLKAGWMIDRRPRQERVYSDIVYIEPSGRSHWSITRAYAMLTKKVKDGDADSNEVSAFVQIPDEDISMLFRHVDKELGYKKKKNRIWKDGKRVKKAVTPKNKKKDGRRNREKGIIVKKRKPRLLARGSEKGSKQDINTRLLYNKKRNLLSWMIDSGVISSGLKVKYGKRRHTRVFEGTITNNGILCSCCKESMSISEFVGHSGGKVNKGFDNIYLESGVTFRKCLLDSWKKEEESGTIRFNLVDVEGDDPNDDTCNICGDGGNLICCDGCPSTFHQSCLDIQNFPPGDWNCIYCSCKFCGVVSVSAPDKPPSEMLSCGLCEEKFHQSCLTEVEAVNTDSNKPPFCGQKCQELFERLQKYIGVKHELEDGFSWSLLRRSDVSQDLTIHKSQLKIENNSKLAIAFSVMDECFVPIVDGRSGTTIIRNVVYNCGSNFRRLNYAGFLTAVLEKGDELITAASIRLHGSRLAEMPFIGTRHMYRRQGMCRRLLDAIESTLSSIGVEELIIPAIPDLIQTWTKVFGFTPLEESKRQELKSISMMVFPGINMLQKPLIQTDKNVSETTPSDATDCNKMPVDTTDITKDAIDYEKPEEVDYDEKPVVEKEGIDYEQIEEDIILMDRSTSSNGTHSPCDLNFQEKNIACNRWNRNYAVRTMTFLGSKGLC
ncbi:hypothetical protein L2E82_20006 [Cichorium intybus]|uniref:Uncharacterized protein n=1 Tax=Cichorium intybus TaxID=13427 RepID=A0ACB9DSJ7_CICIN|nr:hypothetical protein L2E82_20006 [Cichorium intybus]